MLDVVWQHTIIDQFCISQQKVQDSGVMDTTPKVIGKYSETRYFGIWPVSLILVSLLMHHESFYTCSGDNYSLLLE